MYTYDVAKPREITAEPQTLTVCLGCSVDIPSYLHVSALNAQEIVWFKLETTGGLQPVENPVINSDYSLTLTDVGRDDATGYVAMATNADGDERNGPLVTLEVIQMPREYTCDCTIWFRSS